MLLIYTRNLQLGTESCTSWVLFPHRHSLSLSLSIYISLSDCLCLPHRHSLSLSLYIYLSLSLSLTVIVCLCLPACPPPPLPPPLSLSWEYYAYFFKQKLSTFELPLDRLVELDKRVVSSDSMPPVIFLSRRQGRWHRSSFEASSAADVAPRSSFFARELFCAVCLTFSSAFLECFQTCSTTLSVASCHFVPAIANSYETRECGCVGGFFFNWCRFLFVSLLNV